MANRLIKDSILTSRSIDQLSAEAERCFYRLLTIADDFGRMDADPRAVLSRAFPLRREITTDQLEGWLSELVAAEIIQIYVVGQRRYACFINWDKWNKPRAQKSKFPDPPGSECECEQLHADSNTGEQTIADELDRAQLIAYTNPDTNTYSNSSTTTAREDFGKSDPPPEPDPEPPAGPWWEFTDRALFRDTMESIRSIPLWTNTPVEDLPEEPMISRIWTDFEAKTGGSEDDFRYQIMLFREHYRQRKTKDFTRPAVAGGLLAGWFQRIYDAPPPQPPGGNGKPWQRARKMGAVELGEAAKAMAAEMDANGETEFDLSRVSGFDLREVIGR
jgi:hypothetical protein